MRVYTNRKPSSRDGEEIIDPPDSRIGDARQEVRNRKDNQKRRKQMPARSEVGGLNKENSIFLGERPTRWCSLANYPLTAKTIFSRL